MREARPLDKDRYRNQRSQQTGSGFRNNTGKLTKFKKK